MDHIILGGPSGSGGGLFLHEYGWSDDGQPRAPNGLVYAETGAIALGEGDKRWNCTQVVFDGATDPNNPAFGLSFAVREQPFGDEWDTGLYTTVNPSGLMDVRFSGRHVRMRVEATADQPFGVGKLRLEVVPGGRR